MKRVAIDSGHGGSALGAVSIDGEFTEKILNRITGIKVQQQLSGIDWITSHLLRWDDDNVTFTERGRRANQFRADLVVSIHYDSLPSNPQAHGLSCYHQHDHVILKSMASWIVNQAPLQLRGGRVIDAYDDPQRNDDDWLEKPQHIVESFDQDMLLVECAFLSNASDRNFLRLPYTFDLIASSIVSGIVRYFQIL